MFLLFSFTFSLVSSLNCIANFSDQTTYSHTTKRSSTAWNNDEFWNGCFGCFGYFGCSGCFGCAWRMIHSQWFNSFLHVQYSDCWIFEIRWIWNSRNAASIGIFNVCDWQNLRFPKSGIFVTGDIQDVNFRKTRICTAPGIFEISRFWRLNLFRSVSEILDF